MAVNGFDTYYWVVDEPDSSDGIQNDINPGDSLVFRLGLICRQAGEYVLPLHTTVFSGNGIGFFSTADSITIKVSNPCGDADGSGAVNMLDVVFLIKYLYVSDDAPDPIGLGDADGNLIVNLLDITFLINYLFKGDPEPVCPED